MAYIVPHIDWQKKVFANKFVDGVIWFGTIDSSAKSEIAAQHGEVLLECYIDYQELIELAQSNGTTPQEIFENEILPDAAHLKSGDLGEILSRSILQEWRDAPKFPLYRWRNRSTKNDTVRGVDLIGYVYLGDAPSPDDLLVLCEVKTRATTTKPQIVRQAFDGVSKDFITRLTNSLYFYQILLRKDGCADEALHYARFSNPHLTPYKKRLVACVVHDCDSWDDAFFQELPDRHQLPVNFEVVVICVNELMEWIEEVHRQAVASVIP